MTTDTATPRTDAMWSGGKGDTTYQRSLYEFAAQQELDLRECVELLRDVRGTLRADEYGGHARIARKIDALLARYKGTPNLSALQERDDAQG